MSIHTLARKAQALYCRNHSVGSDGFSLNGKLRVQGIHENISRSQTSTPFRGTVPVGNAGSCGTYNVHVISQCSYMPQPLVKRTVRASSGYTASLQNWHRPINHSGPLSNSIFACYVGKAVDSSTHTQKLKACGLSTAEKLSLIGTR